jgi:peptide/nickel transport system substrate-binding protein
MGVEMAGFIRYAGCCVSWALLIGLVVGCDHEPPLPGQANDRLVMVLDDVPRNLDPRFASDATSMRVSRLVFSSLITVDNPELEPRLDLAAKHPEEDPNDPRVWIVTVRQGAFWHDGKPVTAHDVVYTFQSVMDPALVSPFRDPYQAHIDRVEALDDHRVRFVLKEPYATFVTDLVLGVVPKHVCEPNGGRFPTGKYVGSGPFQFVQRIGERRLDLMRNEAAIGGAPKVRHLIFRVIRDEGTRLLALLSGSADLMQNGVSPVLNSVLEENERLAIDSIPSVSFTYLALNMRHSALGDVRVRQALAYAIPRQRFIDTHLNGRGTLATSMLAPTPSQWAYEPDVRRYEYNPERARELLAEAGYGHSGKSLSVTIKISMHRFRRTVARAIAQAWREVGVDASVRSFEFGTFFADIKRGDFDVYLLDVPEPTEPDMLRWMFHGLGTPWKAPAAEGTAYAKADRRFLSPGALSTEVLNDPVCGSWSWLAARDATRNWVLEAHGISPPYSTANRMGYMNPLVDCRLELGQRLVAREDRKPHYQAVQRILSEEVPVIPLWHEHLRVVRQRHIKGFVPLPHRRLTGLRSVTVEAKRP